MKFLKVKFLLNKYVFNIFVLFFIFTYLLYKILKLFSKTTSFKFKKLKFKSIVIMLTINIINQIFHLINFKSALRTLVSLEFHNPSALRTQPLFPIFTHHPADACSFYPFS